MTLSLQRKRPTIAWNRAYRIAPLRINKWKKKWERNRSVAIAALAQSAPRTATGRNSVALASTSRLGMAARVVARLTLGRRDLLAVHGHVFRGAYGIDPRTHPALAEAVRYRRTIPDHSFFRPQERALHGIFYFLPADLPGRAWRPHWLALDVGICGALLRRGLLDSGRNPPSLRGQPHGLTLRFPARFHRRFFRGSRALAMVPLARPVPVRGSLLARSRCLIAFFL